MIDANISADAQPAAIAMRMFIISCPAPLERLEAERCRPPQPSATGAFPQPYEACSGAPQRRTRDLVLANDVRQQSEEPRALDGASELTLLLGRDRGDAARHDLAALGYVTH